MVSESWGVLIGGLCFLFLAIITFFGGGRGILKGNLHWEDKSEFSTGAKGTIQGKSAFGLGLLLIFSGLLSLGIAIFFLSRLEWYPLSQSIFLIILVLAIFTISIMTGVSVYHRDIAREKENKNRKTIDKKVQKIYKDSRAQSQRIEKERQQGLLIVQRTQELCIALCGLGVKARLSETAGLIDIAESPIQQVDIREVYARFLRQEVISVCVHVADSRRLPWLKIKVEPIRIWGIFGPAIAVCWKGDDRGTGLRKDKKIKAAIVGIGKSVKIQTRFIPSEVGRSRWELWPIKIVNLSLRLEQWRVYEMIAARLLALDFPGLE